jgi:hypothetical protein
MFLNSTSSFDFDSPKPSLPISAKFVNAPRKNSWVAIHSPHAKLQNSEDLLVFNMKILLLYNYYWHLAHSE